MQQSERDDIPFLQFDSLPTNGTATHAVFTRWGGVSQAPFAALNLSTAVADDRANVAENRRRAYGVFGRTRDTLVHAHLIHADTVTRVSCADHGRLMPRTDALITDDPGCGLTMNFADCAPIFLYDPVHKAIGLGHAGWKGSVCDLPGAMVRAMQAAFGSAPAALLASVGPCISVERYEVDEPLTSAVRDAFAGDVEQLLRYPNGPDRRPHYDLLRANALNLRRAGVENVELAPYCTAERTDIFFSHRAEQGRTGRFGTIFTLAAKNQTDQ